MKGGARSSSSGGGNHGVAVVFLIAALVVFLYFFTGGVVSQLYKTDALAPPVLYTESPYTSVIGGSQKLCEAHLASKIRVSEVEWKKAAAEYNSQGSSDKVTGEELTNKARLWKDAESGIVGRDRVLCVGQNQDPNVDRLALVYHKWAHRCDRNLLFAPTADIGRDVPKHMVVEMHPFGGDAPNNLWQRFRFMVDYLMKWPHLDSVDFIYFYGDDAYTFVRNLKKLLREPHVAMLDRLGVPLIIGHRMTSGQGDIFVSNAAWIMNPTALRIMGSMFAAGRCDPLLTGGTDDLPISQCMAKLGISMFDSYDIVGEDRFTPFSAGQVADLANDPKLNPWYPPYRGRAMPRGRSALSMYPVEYHYADLAEMDRIESGLRSRGES